MIITGSQVPETKPKYIYDRHRWSTSRNLRKPIMAIIFVHGLQNRKSCKVIVRYFAEISQLLQLAIFAKLVILMKTRQTQREPVLKSFAGSRKSLLFHKFSFQFSIHEKSREVE